MPVSIKYGSSTRSAPETRMSSSNVEKPRRCCFASSPDGGAFTRMLLDRVTVIGVGSTTPVSTTTTDETGQQTTEELPRTLMTLAVDQKTAERVLFAAGNGELAFALLNEASTVAPAPGVTADSLF